MLRTMTRRRLRLALTALLACGALTTFGQNARPDLSLVLSPMQAVAASDARFRYEGRIDFADPTAPVLIWQASRVALDWDGEELVVAFGEPKGQNFFDVTIDRQNFLAEVCAGSATVGTVFRHLGPGRHHLVLVKRSEAAAGTVPFLGVQLAPGARVYAPAAPDYRLRMLFLGDSINAGACAEDGAVDQWETRRTHNGAKSYPALTAAAFHAGHQNIALSGAGIVTGYTPVRAAEFWDRLYPEAAARRADLPGWVPDVVLVNLGDNDDAFTSGNHQPFPAGFESAYVAFIRTIRAAYPHAQVVLMTGGMFNGTKSEPLLAAWGRAVQELETQDPAVAHFLFTHWTNNHPRVADHRILADELTAWLRAQPFMAKWTNAPATPQSAK